MEKKPSYIDAAIAYIPVIGWLYTFLSPRRDDFSMFHLRQSIGLVLFVLGVFAGWAIVAWVISWIPFGVVAAVILFTLVIGALIFGVIAWVMGTANALRGEMTPLPIFGRWAYSLFS